MSSFRKPRTAIHLSFVTLVIIFGMHAHELIYYTIIKQNSQCIISYKQQFISTYDRVNAVMHYIVPFIIQTMSITFLIVQTAKSRVRTSNNALSLTKTFKRQFYQNKEQYLTPIIIILCALPQLVISFSLSCTPLTETTWKRVSLLITYLLSFVPQLLGFILYVLPSTSYKQEFKKTAIAKSRLFKCLLFKSTPQQGQNIRAIIK
ncbi:unnamed protein product [Didymodactylos carnosus]|uniref:G-protein coupled receptors family 1 profile domain-containing protein n=1 Tax=Didymodactylos carnosus TaxID=1234261 RepID=A0A816A0C5_9BILA|nr:unnamed protein product [Didymodactylos carnosus]CAF4461412.1 unnamed protein product [Didymodactylos carnosus]